MPELTFLTNDFVIELSKSALSSEKMLEVCKAHLKYQYLENETQKKFFKFIYEKHDLERIIPSYGTISQSFPKDEKFTSFLSLVKKTRDVEHSQILNNFEEFIKDRRFRILYDDIGTLYNQGKSDEAIQLLATESNAIRDFSLKTTYYTRIFHDFDQRHEDRVRNIENNNILHDKCSYGIPAIDDVTRGGFEKGTAICILARSGVGKSTWLKWIALANARLGMKVLHFQAEGTEKECNELYDSAWTSITLEDIELGVLPESKRVKIRKTQQDIIKGGGEIFVYAKEEFEALTLNECLEVIQDIESIYGKLDLVIFDYMEIFTVKGIYGNTEAAERKRREDLANRMVNIGTKFKVGVATATQANDIPPTFYNNAGNVLTRHHISEFKGAIKPFSGFLTLNQTDDEYEEGVMRIYADKFRKHKSNQTWSIAQSRENGRFYNAKRTVELFG